MDGKDEGVDWNFSSFNAMPAAKITKKPCSGKCSLMKFVSYKIMYLLYNSTGALFSVLVKALINYFSLCTTALKHQYPCNLAPWLMKTGNIAHRPGWLGTLQRIGKTWYIPDFCDHFWSTLSLCILENSNLM